MENFKKYFTDGDGYIITVHSVKKEESKMCEDDGCEFIGHECDCTDTVGNWFLDAIESVAIDFSPCDKNGEPIEIVDGAKNIVRRIDKVYGNGDGYTIFEMSDGYYRRMDDIAILDGEDVEAANKWGFKEELTNAWINFWGTDNFKKLYNNVGETK